MIDFTAWAFSNATASCCSALPSASRKHSNGLRPVDITADCLAVSSLDGRCVQLKGSSLLNRFGTSCVWSYKSCEGLTIHIGSSTPESKLPHLSVFPTNVRRNLLETLCCMQGIGDLPRTSGNEARLCTIAISQRDRSSYFQIQCSHYPGGHTFGTSLQSYFNHCLLRRQLFSLDSRKGIEINAVPDQRHLVWGCILRRWLH